MRIILSIFDFKFILTKIFHESVLKYYILWIKLCFSKFWSFLLIENTFLLTESKLYENLDGNNTIINFAEIKMRKYL